MEFESHPTRLVNIMIIIPQQQPPRGNWLGMRLEIRAQGGKVRGLQREWRIYRACMVSASQFKDGLMKILLQGYQHAL
jgi:hypothetical protein